MRTNSIGASGLPPSRSWRSRLASAEPRSRVRCSPRGSSSTEPECRSWGRKGSSSPGSCVITATTQRRLHQEAFRVRVLRAYSERCAVCRLRHSELLDAAHILPDGHPRGRPIVPNGLALCKLHHAAFDRHILGARPDLIIEIRRDEHDGPMLTHGLQGFQGTRISVPRADPLRPDRELLAERKPVAGRSLVQTSPGRA